MIRLGPPKPLLRLGSGPALVRLELSSSGSDAGSAHARWDSVARVRSGGSGESFSGACLCWHRPKAERRDTPRPGITPAQARLGPGSGSARAQLERLGRGLVPCEVGLLGESAIWLIRIIILRRVFVLAQTEGVEAGYAFVGHRYRRQLGSLASMNFDVYSNGGGRPRSM